PGEVKRDEQRRAARHQGRAGPAFAELKGEEQQARRYEQDVEGLEREVIGQAAHAAEIDEEVGEPETGSSSQGVLIGAGTADLVAEDVRGERPEVEGRDRQHDRGEDGARDQRRPGEARETLTARELTQ